MKILILGQRNPISEEDRNYYQGYIDLFSESSKLTNVAAEVFAALIEDLVIAVGDGDFSILDTLNGRQLNDYDVIFMRSHGFRDCQDVAATISEYSLVNNIRIVNEYGGIRDSSKLLQAVHFHLLKVPVAKTLLVTQAVFPSNFLDEWQFPCIMKAAIASHGNDNYVVNDAQEVEKISNENPRKRFVLQRLIPNDGDYRLLIAGKDVLIIHRRAVEGSHLNNTSQGGEAEMVNLGDFPRVVIEQSMRVMKRLGMTIAGVDVIRDSKTGEYYFLEVNVQPQIMTGAFLQEKKVLIGKLLKDLSNQG